MTNFVYSSKPLSWPIEPLTFNLRRRPLVRVLSRMSFSMAIHFTKLQRMLCHALEVPPPMFFCNPSRSPLDPSEIWYITPS